MLEREFQRNVVATARSLGWMVYYTHDSRRSPAGFPDLTLVRERIVFAELKVEGGRVRPEQFEWTEALLDAGAEVYLWRPCDMREIDRILSERDDLIQEVGNDE
jgi:hypothetical protein